MSDANIAKRYARALFDLAEKKGQADLVSKQLSDLVEAWNGSSELQELFENPVVEKGLQKKVIDALASKLGLDVNLKNTLFILVDRSRVSLVSEICNQYQLIVQKKQGVEFAEVTTAEVMSPDYYNQLQQTLEQVIGKKIVLSKKQDSSLVAGAIARVGDRVFDGSLRNQMEDLKQQILTNP